MGGGKTGISIIDQTVTDVSNAVNEVSDGTARRTGGLSRGEVDWRDAEDRWKKGDIKKGVKIMYTGGASETSLGKGVDKGWDDMVGTTARRNADVEKKNALEQEDRNNSAIKERETQGESARSFGSKRRRQKSLMDENGGRAGTILTGGAGSTTTGSGGAGKTLLGS